MKTTTTIIEIGRAKDESEAERIMLASEHWQNAYYRLEGGEFVIFANLIENPNSGTVQSFPKGRWT